MACSRARARRALLLAVAFVAVAVAARGVDAWGDRLFSSKTARPATAEGVEAGKAAAVSDAATVVPEAAHVPNGVPAFSRPSSGSTRGYGLYGRPEEKYPPEYFRRGVHRNAEKLTTTGGVRAAPEGEEEEAVPVGAAGGGSERGEPSSYPESGSGTGRPLFAPYPEDGSGRGRPRPYAAQSAVGGVEQQPASYTYPEADDNGSSGGRRDRPTTYADNGSGRGRPRFAGISDNDQPAASFAESSGSGRGPPMSMSYAGMRGEQQRLYGMSDTRLYQNGRYYYDLDTGKYGYGSESNPMRARPVDEEYAGAGYGRGGQPRAAARRHYGGDAPGFEAQYENGNVDRVAEINGDGFQETQKGRYIP